MEGLEGEVVDGAGVAVDGLGELVDGLGEADDGYGELVDGEGDTVPDPDEPSGLLIDPGDELLPEVDGEPALEPADEPSGVGELEVVPAPFVVPVVPLIVPLLWPLCAPVPAAAPVPAPLPDVCASANVPSESVAIKRSFFIVFSFSLPHLTANLVVQKVAYRLRWLPRGRRWAKSGSRPRFPEPQGQTPGQQRFCPAQPPSAYTADKMESPELAVLENEVVACRRCPRLVEYRERIGREKRRAYLLCDYWARPVPGFGDPSARVLVLGLAPGAHGSNRTGRPFTGDASGKFMYPVLHQLGFASQPEALSREDGLKLHDLWITAAVRCAPPDNKPLPEEIANCAEYTDRELSALKNLKVVIALGKIAFDAYLDALRRQQVIVRKTGFLFAHSAEYLLPNGITLLASYHPSNQNTATGKLTTEMFQSVFARAQTLLH